MGLGVDRILVTGAAALLFAAAFLLGGRVHPMQVFLRDRRSSLSFGAGVSAAYVFVHLVPELHSVRDSFTAAVSVPLRYEGMGIFYLALVGFLVFYGLDHLRSHLKGSGEEGKIDAAFSLEIGGFAAYICLMAYLLVHNLEKSEVSVGFFAGTMALHFLSVDHSLAEEHGAAYRRIGRFVLAGASVAGWGLGLLFALPQYVLALLVAFISGAVIMNSAIMELPSDRDGRFLPFLAGGLIYGLILLPLR
jgi:hypothetical protein